MNDLQKESISAVHNNFSIIIAPLLCQLFGNSIYMIFYFLDIANTYSFHFISDCADDGKYMISGFESAID